MTLVNARHWNLPVLCAFGLMALVALVGCGPPDTPPLPPALPKAGWHPSAPPNRLNYDRDTLARDNGEIALVNTDRFAWRNLHVEVWYRLDKFNCPAPPMIASAHTLRIRVGLCRSESGTRPPEACSIHVEADEGSLGIGFEPCVHAE